MSAYSDLNLSLCISLNRPRNFLVSMLLKTQYLREPRSLPECHLTKEGEDTFSERGNALSRVTAPRNVRAKTTVGPQTVVQSFPLYPTLF